MRAMSVRLTTSQAARQLSVCPNTVKRWIARGVISAYTTPGGHYRILQEELERFLAERISPGRLDRAV